MTDLPMIWATYISMAIFAGIGIVVWLLPKSAIFMDKPPAAWRDMRWWATILVILQIIIYAVFQ